MARSFTSDLNLLCCATPCARMACLVVFFFLSTGASKASDEPSLDTLLLRAERTAQWDVEKALQMLTQAYPLAVAQNDLEKRIQCLALMGDVYAGKTDFTSSVDHYLQAIRLAEENGRNDLAAKSYNGLGTVAYQRKDYSKAEDYFRKAAQLKLDAGKVDHYAMIVTNLSGVMFSIGRYTEAMQHLRSALPQLQNYPGILAAVFNSMGSVHQMGFQRLDSAAFYYSKAIELGEKGGYNDVLISAYHNYGEIEKENGNNDKAIAWLQKALLLSEHLKKETYTLSILQTLSETYKNSGQTEKALEAKERSYQVLEAIHAKEKSETVERLQMQFEDEKKSAELARKSEALLASELKYAVLQNRYTVAVFCALLLGLVGLVIFWNIKQKRKNEERLQAEKYSIFQNIVHEIRTPLTLISGPLRLISTTESIDQLKAQLPIIERNADRLLRMVQELLQFSKIESGLFQPGKEVGDPVLFVQHCCEAFKGAMENNEQQWDWKCCPSRLVEFPKDTVETTVSNLLSNAVRYAGKGARIGVQVELENDKLTIAVSDNGQGVPSHDVPKIFDRFYRGSNATHLSGNGLGLALVREMLISTGGALHYSSLAPQGALFTATIPCSDSTGLKDLRGLGDLPILLLVEDDQDLSVFVQSLFQDDLQVFPAFTMQQALQLVTELSPDMVLTDIALPDGSGLDFLHEIKSQATTSRIPVAVFSARGSAGVKEQALRLGASVYITKPFLPDELRLSVTNLLKEILASRQKTREVLLAGGEAPSSSALHPFVEKAVAAIHDRLDDSEFGPDALAQEMALSRSQLHRKLVSLSGYSTSNFIRIIRLRKAKEFLEQGKGSVKEVAYLCGFNSPSYFSKSFKELFGHSPGNMAENE